MTTKQKVKESLERGEVLTSCSCAARFMTADLRKIVSDLRREGLNIIGVKKISESGKRYNEYMVFSGELYLTRSNS